MNDELIEGAILKLNQIQFSQKFINKLKQKLMLGDKGAQMYISEYKKFLLMAYVGQYMISPSEQVD